MTRRVRRGAAWAALPPGPAEPTLDQLLAEPMVQQLMRRDGIDESTTRRFLQQAALARAARNLGGRSPGSCAGDDPVTILWLLHETARLWRKRYDREIRARIPRHDASAMHGARPPRALRRGQSGGPRPSPQYQVDDAPSPARPVGRWVSSHAYRTLGPRGSRPGLTAGALPMIERCL